MTRLLAVRSALTFGIALLACSSFVEAQDTPFYFVHPSFNSSSIEKIHLLRGVDLSFETKGHKGFDGRLSGRVLNSLKKSGHYDAEFDKTASIVDVTLGNLSKLSPEWIRTIGPAAARWVMLFVIVDSAAGKKVLAKATCEMDLYLFDRVEGTVLYRNRVVQSFADSLIMPSKVSATNAMVYAIEQLQEAFPRKGENPRPPAAAKE